MGFLARREDDFFKFKKTVKNEFTLNCDLILILTLEINDPLLENY